MMAILKLEKSEWRDYLDKVSKAVANKRAEIEIEVDALSFGHQIETRWTPLLGITYDYKSDIVEILLEGMDHMVHKPRDLYLGFGALGLESLEVIDADDVRQIVKLRTPLYLPKPSAACG